MTLPPMNTSRYACLAGILLLQVLALQFLVPGWCGGICQPFAVNESRASMDIGTEVRTGDATIPIIMDSIRCFRNIYESLFGSPVEISTQIAYLDLANPPYDLVEADGYLYVAENKEIRIYDVSDTDKILGLNWREDIARFYSGEEIRGIFLEGKTLYIADEPRLAIMNVSDPSHPTLLSQYSHGSYGCLRDVVVSGSYAYLAIRDRGIQVVDVSDKEHPVQVRTIRLAGKNRPWRIVVNGSFLYVALEDDYRLDILDISDPRSPVVRGSYAARESGNPYNDYSAVAVAGTYAYVAEWYHAMRVIDVSNPDLPREVAKISMEGPSDIKIRDRYAYLSMRYSPSQPEGGGIAIIDISDPIHPRVAGESTELHGYAEGIWPASGYTYAAFSSKGFAVWDTHDPARPRLRVNVPVIGGVDSTITQGPYLYIGAHNDGVWVLDARDPEHPFEIAFVYYPGRTRDLSISGDYLYTAGEWGKVSIIDIQDPTAPKLVKTGFNPPGDGSSYVYHVLADGDTLYTTLGVVDITDPRSPKYLARTAFNGKMAKYGDDYLTVATSDGLQIYDVRTRTDPRPILVC